MRWEEHFAATTSCRGWECTALFTDRRVLTLKIAANMMTQSFNHTLADDQSADIGTGTRGWQFVVILPGARIGQACNICSHCTIENDVVIGDRVTVKSGVQLWDGLRLSDDVFIEPNVTFVNDKFPRSKQYPQHFQQTVVVAGASIGGVGGDTTWYNDWRARHGGGKRGCHPVGAQGRDSRWQPCAHRGVLGVQP
jgi:UDP-3-O-[3-hydroxymyristoyl] glucosamine N-acyltransferase